MTYPTWEDAMEAFCQSLDDATLDQLDAVGMLEDAMVGWCEANGHWWGVPND